MAPSRGKGKAREVPALVPRRSARSRRNAATEKEDAQPDVYGEMVAEAVATDPVETSNRPLKRRKISREPATAEKPVQPKQVPHSAKSERANTTPAHQRNGTGESHSASAQKPQQTAEYSSESEESDFAFEDVDIGQAADSNPASALETDDEEIKDVTISVAPSSAWKKATVNRRKPATAVEKAFRLRVHKVHFLTLLGHCMYANSRCNNPTVQKILRRLIDKRMRSYLNPKANDSQFQRNRSFMDGLEQAKAAFKAEFRITMSGMARPRWRVDGGDESPSSGGEPMNLADFATAAKDLEGSQDTGNQLFCAMLRAADVEARLVCSLQTLPYANPPPKSSTPQKTKRPVVFAIASDTDPNASDASASDASIGSPAGGLSKIPSVRRRLGQPGFTASPKVVARPKEKKKPVRTLSYPVYWVEAFNTAHQKWVPVDPMATNTLGKAGKIEPPASYDLNQLMYVIAFEDNGVARDVTRRYAKAFNAKTRRHRVEGSGEDGAKWLKAALRLFRRRQRLDRDQVEDAELAQKEAREGLPSNVLDFKGHPYYALERHLRRHEVLHPRREAGKVNAGTAAKPRMEPVFRRQDVLSCKSGDKWYRLGREVKQGEQPLKHVPARASRRKDLEDEDDDAGPTTTGLYSIHQTQVYVPPPVKRGKITKNAFGNLDVYVPSMVPPGGVHIRHPLTQQAARALNIDFADSVTGFKFQGRQGTAIIEGAVVPQEYGEAVQAAIEGLEYEALEEESKSRSITALRLWARFMKGLRIAERVAAYGEKSTAEEVDDKEIEEVDFARGNALGSDEHAEDSTMPTAGQYSIVELTMPAKSARKNKNKAYESDVEHNDGFVQSSRRSGRKRGITVIEDDEEDEYLPDIGDGNGGGFLAEDAQEAAETGGSFVPQAYDDDLGGGFVPEDGEGGGGFLPEADNEDGGFVREDENEDDMGGGFVPEDGMGDDEGGGGFLVENAEAELPGDRRLVNDATMLDAEMAQEDDMTAKENSPTATELTPPSARTDQRPASTERQTGTGTGLVDADTPSMQDSAAPAPAPVAVPLAPTANEKEVTDNDSDHGSLLSHDPEDDDAEPDWLESD